MKYRIILLFIFFLSEYTYAQEVYSGKVLDEKNNTPISGVHVIRVRDNQIIHTTDLGTWSLRGSKNDTILFSHIGYKPTKTLISEAKTVLLIKESQLLDQIEIVSGRDDPMETLSKIDIDMRQPANSQEVLRLVPGIFIAQHAGGGKAEQIFTRGFDIDHGTDLLLAVDGMPVNMVSHAHGQGYADLHFLIPELIKEVKYNFGPHSISKGNFSTAGAINFETADFIDDNEVNIQGGSFNNFRIFSAIKLFESEKSNQQFYAATEYLMNDGPFDSPQNYDRINIQGKYTSNSDKSITSITGMYHYSNWYASGQIPPRAVNNGSISRYGSLDPTEGGETSRASLVLNSTSIINKDIILQNDYYLSQYNFDLFSNFTFFLDDPVYGDQIRQKENRLLFGGQSQLSIPLQTKNENDFTIDLGAGFRKDNANDVSLANTFRRNTFLGYKSLGDIHETNLFTFTELSYELKNLSIAIGARIDHFKFGFLNKLDSLTGFKSKDETRFSPKLKASYSISPKINLIGMYSFGFHSNDSRVILANEELPLVPRAKGLDFIVQWMPTSNLIVHAAFWSLNLESELVYVGDAGIVEPSGETNRNGIDLAIRYDIIPSLRLDFDLNLTKARASGSPEGSDYIPLAPSITSMGGITYRKGKFSSNLRYRYLGDRPGDEMYELTAEGYLLFDSNIKYEPGDFYIKLIIENILNEEWEEAQFATESKLQNEFSPITEMNLTPGYPLNFRIQVGIKF
ncbi:TonB-dependent receptor [Marinigracilibium pacificum]|uniref:TonB-dependent receptor plug domain-containing protein n=1 Tax=Marinigracilibium pacificum TaxID=2729599 RepID=A0A848J0G4_9BACT|nr:TonB-dependent receptor plug domain-containing protein [Marinigracilibium pacificum]NMM48858.1 TonB-dependent receptor plug domain-containing protein [Marinigracilibium pacificum]